jgi:hypothetical protein
MMHVFRNNTLLQALAKSLFCDFGINFRSICEFLASLGQHFRHDALQRSPVAVQPRIEIGIGSIRRPRRVHRGIS